MHYLVYVIIISVLREAYVTVLK